MGWRAHNLPFWKRAQAAPGRVDFFRDPQLACAIGSTPAQDCDIPLGHDFLLNFARLGAPK
jgi:hypothetical protein